MPLRLKNSKGKVKYRSFSQATGDLKRKGYSEKSARRIIGHIQKIQHKKRKK